MRRKTELLSLLLVGSLLFSLSTANAQEVLSAGVKRPNVSLPKHTAGLPTARFIDPLDGTSADEGVAYAIFHNGDLLAARSELDAARAMIKQAALRANPMLDISRATQLNGADGNLIVGASLPLELGGRREARISVATRESEMREAMVADRERMLAAEVRIKFGEALADARRLAVTEDLIASTESNVRLIAARVTEGRSAPLETNIMLVEVNRLKSQREMDEGRVEIAMLELRNMIGMRPDELLRLRGDLSDGQMPSLSEATENALRDRPDLRAARAAEVLAQAIVEQARREGRIDASLIAQYQLMNSGFSAMGLNSAGQQVPIMNTFHFLSVGVSISLPVRNKNQGTIEAAIAQSEAARQRREFIELTIRREVAAAYAKYDRTNRALEIYRKGVQGESRRNLDVIKQTYELGSKTLLDVIAEQRRVTELENDYIATLLETYKARIEIERATASTGLVKK